MRSRVLYTLPVTPWESGVPEVSGLTQQWEEAAEGKTDDWGEVVTR